ncbi:MAG: HD domain-containing protein [Fibrobacter sp.]|nr:HD domain-containing protein [Fibrobacter sp.]
MKINYQQAILGGLILTLCTVLLFPASPSIYQTSAPKLGEISTQGYSSPISFDLHKNEKELAKERQEAKDKVLYLFEYNDLITESIVNEFHDYMEAVKSYGILQSKISQNTGEFQAKFQKEAQNLYSKLSQRLSSTAINQLSQRPSAVDNLSNIFTEIMEQGVSEALIASSEKQATLYKELHSISHLKHILYRGEKVALIKKQQRHELNISQILPRETVLEDAFTNLKLAVPYSQGLQSAIYEVLYAFVNPNIFFLEKETLHLQALAAKKVNPIKGKVVKGMDIVRPGSIITVNALEKITALENALNKHKQKQKIIPSKLAQQVILVIFSFLFVATLIWYNHQNNFKWKCFWAQICIHILQILGLFGVFQLGMRINSHNALFPLGTEMVFLQPFILAPVLSTVLFNYKLGLLSVIFSALHLGIQSGFDLAITMTIFFIGAASTIFLHNIRYRYQFIFSNLSGIFASVLALTIYFLLRNRLNFEVFWLHLFILSISLVFSIAFCSLFLINLFEKLFGLTTNLSLIELSDLNHPVLKLLSEQAPGSFHHSIMVSNLVEPAAQNIKANALLVRVMALYHDIGKIQAPHFFVENQMTDVNPHDQLSPWESVKIIKDHVQFGLNLAHEHKIPAIVAAGIAEHHGSSIIQYFYKKAVQNHPDKVISPDDFRHQGPPPQSKESAILMLADSIEAMSRSMDEPTAEELVELVQKVVKNRFEEEQLHQSGLSLTDLKAIENGFLHSLEGMYHTRIAYPE